MRTRRDFLTPTLLIFGIVIVILALWVVICDAQTHTMPGSNVVPSGASLTIQSGASITAAGGSTVTGFGGGTGTVTSITATTPIIVTPSPLVATGVISLDSTKVTNWDTAFTQVRQWDGGATGLVAATGRTSLALVIGTNVQAYDADLTTWAGITPVAAVGTWIATPSSANLRAAVSDENGTGAALFSGATSPDFTTGITIGAAAATGKILIGDGTKFAPSTPSWPTTAGSGGGMLQSTGVNIVVSTPTWPTTAGTVGYLVRSDGTNFAAYPNQQTNSSITNLSVSTSDIYLAGSACTVAAGDFKAGGQYRCVFDMVKSAGTGAIVISVRIGTAGTTSDTARLTFTFGSGTSVADSGVFDVVVNWRSVGSGTSAVVQGICRGTHNLATTGLFNNAAGWVIIGTPSGGFNSSTATTIGLSFTGATAFAGTNSLVQSQVQQ